MTARPLPGPAGSGGWLRLPAILLLAGLVWPLPVVGAQTSMSPDRQVPLILKVLTYDRQFEAKAGAEVNIGIVYSPADANSSKTTTEISGTLNKFSGKTVKRLPINYWTIEYVSPARLEEVIKDKGINVIYVSPGNDNNLASILKLSQARNITTTTGVADYVRKGVSVGIGSRQGKPQILINLAASKSEGSEFDASLLRIATVVQ